VSVYELVHERGYLVEGEQARGVPVEYRGVVDVIPVPFERGPDREVLYGHVRRAMRGELRRQGADDLAEDRGLPGAPVQTNNASQLKRTWYMWFCIVFFRIMGS
jgi:hypothetical protein